MNALCNFLLILFLSAGAFAKPACLDETKSAFLKGEQLRGDGQYLLSLQQYAVIANFACNENEKAAAHLASAQALFKLGETQAAEQSLKDLFATKGTEATQKKGRLLQAWYTPELRHRLPADEQKMFSTYEENALQLQKKNRIKNPWVSGISSAVLPGLGQVYNGNYQSAAFSFILNSLFLATALELNRKGLQTSSLAAGLIFSITYTGNILGSVDSTNTINRNSAQPLLERERQKTISGLEL